MGKLFGTDGVRGIAGKELTADLAYKLGAAVSYVLSSNCEGRPVVVIGKDTRCSGDMFESAVSAGLCSMGSDVALLGVVPTPAVAYLVKELGASAGVMISASHNPSEYNGIKVFGPEGYKLSDELEARIEDIILEDTKLCALSGAKIGRVRSAHELIQKYNSHVASVMEDGSLPSRRRRRVMFDLSNGSASATAKKIFTEANSYGFFTSFIAYDPDGMNINDNCGSTQMKALCRVVRDGAYDIGIAFDGDADRCLITDENGGLINGDAIIARLAYELKLEGKLRGNAAVVTTLTNLGFHIAAKKLGFEVKVTDVGDRYVLEEMLRGGYAVGGEQSGHIILTDYATTGDGQITAAMILRLLAKYPEQTVSEIFSIMTPLPQISINVKAPQDKKLTVCSDPEVVEYLKRAEDAFAGSGRIVLRPSGTEALIRIMLEGRSEDELVKLGNELAALITKKLC